MPVPTYVTYKCKRCGFTFTNSQGDVIIPWDLDVRCPICFGEVEVVSTSLEPPKNPNSIIDKIKEIFGKE